MTRAWLALLTLIACDCGGGEFTVGDAIARLDAGALAPIDAGPSVDTPPRRAVLEHDAGPTPRDAGAERAPDVASDPPADGGAVVESGLASDPDADATAPPPALCCMTPCSGASVAPIACDNGPAWTCAAGSCADRACAPGTACSWMGSVCTGHVAVCP